MHFSFNLLRIKGLYIFRALRADPQEALHKRHLVYCVRIMSVKLQPCHSHLTLYARNTPNAVCVAPSEDEQVMLETSRGLWFSINWMISASRWFHYTDILWCAVSKTLSFPLTQFKFLWPILAVIGGHCDSSTRPPQNVAMPLLVFIAKIMSVK
jgi:hypothetical protein